MLHALEFAYVCGRSAHRFRGQVDHTGQLLHLRGSKRHCTLLSVPVRDLPDARHPPLEGIAGKWQWGVAGVVHGVLQLHRGVRGQAEADLGFLEEADRGGAPVRARRQGQ